MLEITEDEGRLVQIREIQRFQLYHFRRQQKDEDIDVRRSLPKNLPTTEEDVNAIIDKLKTRAPVNVVELNALQLAVLEEDNRKRLIGTPGVLRGLVRELTGNNLQKQIAACSCLSNVALREEKACPAITRAAGAYIITGLSSMSIHFTTACAFALGNLVASGGECSRALLALGASKLCDVTPHDDVTFAAVYALSYLVANMRDELILEHLEKIIKFLSKLEINRRTARLLFMTSCHHEFTHDLLPEAYLRDIIEKVPHNIKGYLARRGQNPEEDYKIKKEYSYLLRVLSNMSSNKLYKGLMIYFLENNMAESFKELLDENDPDVMWFLGNMMKECGEHRFFKKMVHWREESLG